MENAKSRWIYVLICLAIFASGLATGTSAVDNMVMILYFELLIIALCFSSLQPNVKAFIFMRQHLLVFILAGVLLIVLLVYYYFTKAQNFYILLILFAGLTRDMSPYYERFKNNKFLLALFVLWLISISISFYTSPYGVANSYLSRVRYEQSIVHFIVFFCLMVFLQDKKPPGIYLLLAIPASILIVGFCSLYIYLSDEVKIGAQQWFGHPPFNAHIRHVGYQVTAGLSILLAFFAAGAINGLKRWSAPMYGMHFIATTLLWGFLFWCGGRASIGSVLVLLALIGLLLWKDRARFRYFILSCFISLVLGMLLSEWLSVFSWNGLFENVERTAGAGTMFELTSGRNYLWALAWKALSGHWLFGFGANAYVYIDGVTNGVGQPHGIFIQFLVEWGIIGSLLFMVLLMVSFVRRAKLLLHDGMAQLPVNALAAVSVIVALSIHGIVDGTFFHAQPVFSLVVVFAVWFSEPQTGRRRVVGTS